MAACGVLVVDDDPLILSTVSEILAEDGYEVETAQSALEAARAVARRHPSVVLLDMRMPGLDGWKLAEQLRARDPSTKILVLTAARNARRWADQIHADGYLGKPFDISDLLRAVGRLCQERHPAAD